MVECEGDGSCLHIHVHMYEGVGLGCLGGVCFILLFLLVQDQVWFTYVSWDSVGPCGFLHPDSWFSSLIIFLLPFPTAALIPLKRPRFVYSIEDVWLSIPRPAWFSWSSNFPCPACQRNPGLVLNTFQRGPWICLNFLFIFRPSFSPSILCVWRSLTNFIGPRPLHVKYIFISYKV